MDMTDADRPAVDALLQRLEQHYRHELSPDAKAMYFTILMESNLSIADVEAAIEYYLRPPWPPPVLILRAHRERVERVNHEADFKLADELLREEPSERRDALLRILGFGRELPPKPPDRKM